MAKTTFEKGDLFAYNAGHGVVRPDGSAFLMKSAGRKGYAFEKGSIPPDAKPIELTGLDYEVKIGLTAVAFVDA